MLFATSAVDAELAVDQVALLEHDPPAQRIFHGARLLEDLLEHEVLVAALFGLDRAPVDLARRALDRAAVAASRSEHRRR